MTVRGLSARGLTKVFGGLTAVNNVSLDLSSGTVHAVIGPNGAGKTTLINMLSGDLAPTAGSIQFDGRDIVGYSSDQRSRMGLGRTYQKTNIFGSFTALENCRLAAQSREAHALSIWRSTRAYPSLEREAERALAAVGLEQRAKAIAGTLSHGEQRQLDIAMSLATRPQVLLLDEPLSGMGADESASMVGLLRGLAKDHAVLLVEHDMDAVFALAEVLTVMVNGCVLASGTRDQIRASDEVQRAYLGSAEARGG
ncbi:MAG TPA: ABC transporter ATP-binding protein [Myxococcaceae bacterium]|nr:ABC transporter ATP-binding protein [Myxococcaceae bacterium]